MESLMKLPSIQQVFSQANRTIVRFPFVLCCALSVVSTALIIIENQPSQNPTQAYPILLAAGLGLPLLAALALCAEKRKWSPGLSAGSQLLGVLLLLGYGFTVPNTLPQEPAFYFIRFCLLAMGLILLVMILPYMKKGELNGFWQYNKALFFRLFITGIFSAVLYAGLAIALAALDNLFGVSIPPRRYGELWVLVAGLFAPWFLLSGVPEELDGLDRIEEYPKGLKIFAQYILLSLMIVYFVILYAYLLKILLQWSWPKGWVSGLIIGFSTVSILSLLIMHPFRALSGNAWIRAAGKWLYIVLIPLIVVLFLAVTERIGDYGITESRYVGIAFGTWLSAQVLYFLFSRSKSIKFTIGSLCLLAFLMSFGPWSMFSVSERNQVARLNKLLAKNGILISGKVQKEHRNVSQEDVKNIYSIVNYLSRIHGYDAIQPWFAEKLNQDKTPEQAQIMPAAEVLKKMGLDYQPSWDRPGNWHFSVDTRTPADISGYDRILQVEMQPQITNANERRFDGDGISYTISREEDKLTILIGDTRAGFDAVQVDMRAFAEKLIREYGAAGSSIAGRMTPESMAMVTEQGGHKVKILFQRLDLGRQDGKTKIWSHKFSIAYTARK
jgi:hypothetical protein